MRPNLPVTQSVDTTRRHAQAINELLSRLSYIHLEVPGQPTVGQSLVKTRFPVALRIVSGGSKASAETGATGSPVFTLRTNGFTSGTVTFAGTAGTYSITNDLIPANTLFEIIAPSPQDATLADVTLSIAVAR